jgi:putative transposase
MAYSILNAGIPTIPRPSHFIVLHQTHHIVQRGNNRQAVFFSDLVRQVFLKWLGEALAAKGCVLHAYVLMTHHFHLLITTSRTHSIQHLMQQLRRRYVSHVNREYRHMGALWDGRYKSAILDSKSYVLACHCYVEFNPVRAHLVSRPEAYPWSSYRHNALGIKDPLLRDHTTFTALGATVAARRATYRELFGPGLTGEQVETIRDAKRLGARHQPL